ncbi:lysophospholipase [Leptospira perolatii]|uniref:Monoacylglycerol lipase n=1 Tax=Leptospira perolatii TaxID=2023191 RepID=A0A2M9ZRW3_9LEPT|nr:alpha/beta hydrolase [Leptospira perolatii]PJZ71286.1 lysophospholipase [Leptospira perolatii]PJZ74820.1 lysophospholipase [Leptospira perolatii]
MSELAKYYDIQEKSFQNKDKLRISYKVCRSKNPVPGRVLVVHHGIGEHSGRYENLLEGLQNDGWVVYIIDAKGHGKSEGSRGIVKNFSEYLDDLNQLIEIAKDAEHVEKVFLLGHSMGADVALFYSGSGNHQDKLRGLVLSGLAIEVKSNVIVSIQRGVGSLAAKLTPTLGAPTGLNIKDLSRDKAVVEAYKKDPLVHGMASAALGNFLLNCYNDGLKMASNLKIPVYLFHGKSDNIVMYTGTVKAFETIPSKDKSMNIYEGLYHETMNELESDKRKVLSDLASWLAKHS